MQKGLQVIYRGVNQTEAINEAVLKNVARLERYCDHITGCRVVLDSPHNRHHKGKTYHVTVDVSVPQKDVVVNRDQHDKHAHEDLYVAIRDAFNATERQLKALSGKQKPVRGRKIEPMMEMQ